MPLERYKHKRDFDKTPEPSGSEGTGEGPSPGRGRRFVVQRHRATRLHYDFRLEIDGVLVSWAVPKGPTLDPSQRRLAVHVEDHPLEYFDFEGVIPSRQYGAGDVIVWDWGTWEPEDETPDPGRAVAEGELKFRLYGEKLRGRFTIVRTSGRGAKAGGRAFEEDEGDQWLLIHKRDDEAVADWNADDHPRSVKTGRTNDEVKENRDALWIGAATAATAQIDLEGAVDAPLPKRIEPMLATLATKPFRDPDWLFEIKWDGYRLEAIVDDRKVRTWTRNGQDGNGYFPGLLDPPTWIDARQAIVDGEVAAIDDQGLPDFNVLQERISEHSAAGLVFEAFDLLYLDGRSLLGVPLGDRKRLLKSVLRETGHVRFSAHIEAEGVAFYEASAARGLEGVIAKHRRSRYEPGRRSSAWLKLKIRPEQELVVGGWTPGEGRATELGALVVGVYENGRLRYAGKVGSGFDARTRRDLRARFEKLETDTPPFDPVPPGDHRGRWGGDLRGAVWLKPELVIRAELGGWSREGYVRQSSFKGLEIDRDPREVTREQPVETREAVEDVGEAARVQDAKQKKGPSVKKPARSPARSGTSRSRSKVDDGHLHPWKATMEELSALDHMGREGPWKVGGFELKLTNLDKVLFPPPTDASSGPVTKRDLVRYFAQIAPTMLPHLAERPLNLHRYPNGADGQGFWQKDIPESAPSWLRRWREVGVEAREANDHLIADRVATLCWLGNQAAFEVHAWTSRLDDPGRPTFALIDIDPGTKTTWDETLALARLFRTALGHLDVRGYPKLTGRRGIQIWIPIVARYTYGDTSRWVEALSRAVGGIVPDLVSWEWSKDQRQGRARLDYTQNAAIKTLVAPYAVRPAAGAPVSAPIDWDELDDPSLRPDRWTIRTIVKRVADRGDLFAPAQTDLQELPQL
jgi:bifunctional non-homologous end joining protein LigD